MLLSLFYAVSISGQEGEDVPINRVLGPLPESAFVVAARDTIPSNRSRVTTASTRGTLRGRGRSTATRAARGTGTGKGKKRSVQPRTTAQEQDHDAEANDRARAVKRGYKTGPGSAHHLLFGNQNQRRAIDLPDLNAEVTDDLTAQELFLSQSAPAPEDI